MAVERIRIRRDAAATWTSANPTLGLGEMGIETDTGRVKVGDGATAWITLDYAYAKADRVVSKSADYTITGSGDDNVVNVTTAATDRTITLPAGSGMAAGDTIEVRKVDSGTGKVTIARASTDTIDGETAIDIDSQYDMARLRWTGAYWTLTEYKDHGSNSDGRWQRFADGTMRQQVEISYTTLAVATGFGGVKMSDEQSAGNWPIVFTEVPNIQGTTNGSAAWVAFTDTTDLSTSGYPTYRLIRGDTSDITGRVNLYATGRWRA